jgi:hypothetical protein
MMTNATRFPCGKCGCRAGGEHRAGCPEAAEHLAADAVLGPMLSMADLLFLEQLHISVKPRIDDDNDEWRRVRKVEE